MNNRTIIIILSILVIASLGTSFFMGTYLNKYKTCNEENEILQEKLDSLTRIISFTTDSTFTTDTVVIKEPRKSVKPKFANTGVIPKSNDSIGIPIEDEGMLNVYAVSYEDSSILIEDDIIVDGELIDIMRNITPKTKVIKEVIHTRDTITINTVIKGPSEPDVRNALMLGASYSSIMTPQVNTINQFHINIGYQIKNRHELYFTKGINDLSSFTFGYNLLLHSRR